MPPPLGDRLGTSAAEASSSSQSTRKPSNSLMPSDAAVSCSDDRAAAGSKLHPSIIQQPDAGSVPDQESVVVGLELPCQLLRVQHFERLRGHAAAAAAGADKLGVLCALCTSSEICRSQGVYVTSRCSSCMTGNTHRRQRRGGDSRSGFEHPSQGDGENATPLMDKMKSVGQHRTDSRGQAQT